MEALLDPSIWISLATLAALEIILGVDNLVFIAILSDRLPVHQRSLARKVGLGMALGTRLLLLASLAWIIGLTQPLFRMFDHDVSWRDLILIVGGIFLIVKATHEIHGSLEGEEETSVTGKVAASFVAVVSQIAVIDIVFSLDSVITAVGMVKELWVMVTAVVIAMVVMLIAADPLATFVSSHPTVKMLALSFLLLIGTALIADGFGVHIPKGYIYTAMGFSVLVEVLNLIARRKKERAPVKLRHDV